MTTLPQSNTRPIQNLDERITQQIERALSERRKARERGDWVSRQGWDLVIDSLLRVMRGREGAQ